MTPRTPETQPLRSRATVVAAAGIVLATVVAGAPSAQADPGHAPDAPAALTVDDRTHPLNVEGAPRFGWLPRDADPGETQTAYRITVTAAGGDLAWDSGRVASDQRSYVSYCGPALRAGAAYEWTVRTWDRAGQQSPPGAGAFETGNSDIQWEGASWIRRATTDADDYTLAGTEVHPNTSPVVRARAYTAADHTYELHLNGTRADGIEDGRAVFQVGSGRSTFHPVADTAAQPR